LAAIRDGLCGPAETEKCRAEFGENLAWACGQCRKKRAEDLSPYTVKLLRRRALIRAGYPVRADDLGLDEWMDLGEVTAALDGGKGRCPLAG
jgi:hypothetical protein